MKVAISGSSGLIGSVLIPRLESVGHTVVRLVRDHRQHGANDIYWQPASHILDPQRLEGLDVVIHLGGQNIASGYWTKARRHTIQTSRTQSTSFLSETIAGLRTPPRLFMSASAVGYYGHRGDEWLDESASPGTGFLAETCIQWEQSTAILAARAIRVVILRFGMVLSRRGGALKFMAPAFRWGLGGMIGDGSQYVSWITAADVAAVVNRVIDDATIRGPVNVVAPNPVTNREFTKVLAHTLRRPAYLPLPASVARLLFGALADELLLASARVTPRILLDAGYSFAHPELPSALRKVLNDDGKNARRSV